MKAGLGSYACAWSIGVPGSAPADPLTHARFLELAAAHGFELVQIADNLPLDGLGDADLDALRRLAKSLGIAVEVGTRGIGPERIRRHLELCRFFESPILRVVVDSAGHEPSPREVVELLRPHRGELERSGIALAIENHDRFPAQALVGVLTALDNPCFGICLDTVNSFGSLEGPAVVVEALGPFTLNLHVKDFSIRRASHMMGFTIEGAPAGQGRLDLPWLLDQLHKFGRAPNAILELWPTPENSVEATIAKERQWIEQSARYLLDLVAQRPPS